jgi:hypothetical protein
LAADPAIIVEYQRISDHSINPAEAEEKLAAERAVRLETRVDLSVEQVPSSQV